MGWWITLGILVLLAVLPLGVSAVYDRSGALVRLIAGPVRITLFPRPRKEKKPKKDKKPKEKKKPKQKKAKAKKPAAKSAGPVSGGKKSSAKPGTGTKKPAPPKQEPVKTPEKPPQEPAVQQKKPGTKGGSLTDFLPLVKIALDFLGDFKRKLRVDRLELKLVLAGDDPCGLATNYGRAWAGLGNLLPRLERFLVIKKRDIDIACDFTAAATTVYARLELTITLGRLLAAVFVFAFRALVEFLKIIKRKGGTDNEQKSSQHAE